MRGIKALMVREGAGPGQALPSQGCEWDPRAGYRTELWVVHQGAQWKAGAAPRCCMNPWGRHGGHMPLLDFCVGQRQRQPLPGRKMAQGRQGWGGLSYARQLVVALEGVAVGGLWGILGWI